LSSAYGAIAAHRGMAAILGQQDGSAKG
jgi:hypothetical protein